MKGKVGKVSGKWAMVTIMVLGRLKGILVNHESCYVHTSVSSHRQLLRKVIPDGARYISAFRAARHF